MLLSEKSDRLKRILDILVAMVLLIIAAPVFLLIALLINLDTPGGVFHWSCRIGRDNDMFLMPKFRTMRIDTPQLATHLLPDADLRITRVGGRLRRMSLDELPQLWSVLIGDMSLVGPRPALFNQHDLCILRTSCGIHRLAPGLTGWAQINGRDNVSIEEKVALDEHYLRNRSLLQDARILLLTLVCAIRGDDVANTGPRSAASGRASAA